MSIFDPIAKYYDLEHEDFQEDIEFYKNFATATNLPVLELACGTGRILVPLAKAGFTVTGIDNSAEMLDIARGKIGRGLEDRIRLEQADMQSFRLEDRFGLAIIALDGFMHLDSLEAQAQTLHCIARHLIPGGTVIVDLDNPVALDGRGEEGVLLLHWVKVDPTNGHRIAKLFSSTGDSARQARQITLFYDDVDGMGCLKRTVSSFDLRYLFRYEMQLLLESCGFSLDQVYGSYDLDDYESASERMIFVASRRK